MEGIPCTVPRQAAGLDLNTISVKNIINYLSEYADLWKWEFMKQNYKKVLSAPFCEFLTLKRPFF